jgi:hypothetical protein
VNHYYVATRHVALNAAIQIVVTLIAVTPIVETPSEAPVQISVTPTAAAVQI